MYSLERDTNTQPQDSVTHRAGILPRMLRYYALLLGFLAPSLQGKSLGDGRGGIATNTCILTEETALAEPQWDIRVDLNISVSNNTHSLNRSLWDGLRDLRVSCVSLSCKVLLCI